MERGSGEHCRGGYNRYRRITARHNEYTHNYVEKNQMYTSQHTHKDGARKYILLRSITKLRLVCYRLSMPLYRAWAVTIVREPVSLPHSLSLLFCLLRLHFGPTPLSVKRYALLVQIWLVQFACLLRFGLSYLVVGCGGRMHR